MNPKYVNVLYLIRCFLKQILHGLTDSFVPIAFHHWPEWATTTAFSTSGTSSLSVHSHRQRRHRPMFTWGPAELQKSSFAWFWVALLCGPWSTSKRILFIIILIHFSGSSQRDSCSVGWCRPSVYAKSGSRFGSAARTGATWSLRARLKEIHRQPLCIVLHPGWLTSKRGHCLSPFVKMSQPIDPCSSNGIGLTWLDMNRSRQDDKTVPMFWFLAFSSSCRCLVYLSICFWLFAQPAADTNSCCCIVLPAVIIQDNVMVCIVLSRRKVSANCSAAQGSLQRCSWRWRKPFDSDLAKDRRNENQMIYAESLQIVRSCVHRMAYCSCMSQSLYSSLYSKFVSAFERNIQKSDP